MLIWICMCILDHLSIFFTTAELGILGDFLPFLKQSPANFTKLGEMNNDDKAMNPHRFGSDPVDIRIQINPIIRIRIPHNLWLTCWPWRSLRSLSHFVNFFIMKLYAWYNKAKQQKQIKCKQLNSGWIVHNTAYCTSIQYIRTSTTANKCNDSCINWDTQKLCKSERMEWQQVPRLTEYIHYESLINMDHFCMYTYVLEDMVNEAYCGYAGVVGQHKTTDTMCWLHVRRLARESHLYAGGTPRDELCQLAFTNPL